MVEKRRANLDAPIKCKDCVAAAIAEEQAAAALNKARAVGEAQQHSSGAVGAASYKCASCGASKPAAAFSSSQLHTKKVAANKQRCRACVDAAASAEAATVCTCASLRWWRWSMFPMRHARPPNTHRIDSGPPKSFRAPQLALLIWKKPVRR